MILFIKKYWYLVFICLFACSQTEDSNKTNKNLLIYSSKHEKTDSNLINNGKQVITIQRDYFKKRFDLYVRKDLELKNDLNFIDQFVSILSYQNDSLISNIDSLLFKYYMLISSKEEVTYTCFECFQKKNKILFYEIPDYGRVSLITYKNTFKAGCSDFNNYMIINSHRKEIIIIYSHGIQIKTNGIIEFAISVRGKIANSNKIKYSLKNESFMIEK